MVPAVVPVSTVRLWCRGASGGDGEVCRAASAGELDHGVVDGAGGSGWAGHGWRERQRDGSGDGWTDRLPLRVGVRASCCWKPEGAGTPARVMVGAVAAFTVSVYCMVPVALLASVAVTVKCCWIRARLGSR